MRTTCTTLLFSLGIGLFGGCSGAPASGSNGSAQIEQSPTAISTATSSLATNPTITSLEVISVDVEPSTTAVSSPIAPGQSEPPTVVAPAAPVTTAPVAVPPPVPPVLTTPIATPAGFCADLVLYDDLANNSEGFSSSDPTVLRQTWEHTVEVLNRVAASAPADLASDIQIVTSVLRRGSELASSASYDPVGSSYAIAADADLNAKLSGKDPAFTAAQARFAVTRQATCGS
jgi:hypothetical protein